MPFTRAKSERGSCNQYQILLHQVLQFEHTTVAKERLTQNPYPYFHSKETELALVKATSEPLPSLLSFEGAKRGGLFAYADTSAHASLGAVIE
jgi:hypothetical protein